MVEMATICFEKFIVYEKIIVFEKRNFFVLHGRFGYRFFFLAVVCKILCMEEMATALNGYLQARTVRANKTTAIANLPAILWRRWLSVML